MTHHTADICIIGAGSGGLSVAAGASQMGAQVILVEAAEMGGDCLNYGCVPSKALLAAAKSAHAHRSSSKYGVQSQDPRIDFKAVNRHVKAAIAKIEPHDSQERFEGLGVTVIREHGHFIDPHTIKAGDHTIKAKFFVVATGSRASIPPIKGIDATPYLTNESIFELTSCPDHLIIMGGGPIGMEMAQAHRRLGAKVTVIDKQVMPNDDPTLVSVVKRNLEAEGIVFVEGEFVDSVSHDPKSKSVTVQTKSHTIKGSHLLVATGRAANLDNLGLDKAQIVHTPRGIVVNDRLQTNYKHIYALGDCIGSLQFTHVAGYHAGIVIRNILFKLPAKADLSACPWVTYTDPELAHVGLTEDQAKSKHSNIDITIFPFEDNDRAVAENHTEGFIKVISTKKGKILGASIVGQGAGDLIHSWTLALQNGWGLSKMASPIAPYPTRSEISKRVAGKFFTPKLYGKTTKTIVSFLMKYWPWP